MKSLQWQSKKAITTCHIWIAPISALALAKAKEDEANYGAAFDYYAAGNRLKKAQSRYSAARMAEDLQTHSNVCTKEFFAAKASTGHSAPDPIFIVGMPRAGSTLLEQILSSHSQVDGTLELPDILSLAQALRRRARGAGDTSYAAILDTLNDSELESFGKQYIEDTRIHRQGAPFSSTKCPIISGTLA